MTVCLEKRKVALNQEGACPFLRYRDQIEEQIANSISSFGEKTKLRDACEYALTNGGKRFRPLIVLLIAEALGHGLDVFEAALSVEFFHTASLIVDDLPCMDDDDERREKPSLHKVYGEATALLASYALITSAFEKIYRNSKIMQEANTAFSQFADRACALSLEVASSCAGILGATGGQFFDLYPPDHSSEAVHQVIYQKTVTLFEVSFVLGWVFGGGENDKLELVKKAAYHFGMAFQTADDLGDLLQDEQKQKQISIARLLGQEKALLFFEEQIDCLRQILEELKLMTTSFDKMCDLLVSYALKNVEANKEPQAQIK